MVLVPEIEIADVDMEKLRFSGATLKTELVVKNRNSFPLSFRNLHYSIQLEDNEPVTGYKPGTVHIPAKGTATVSIPAQVDLKAMGKNLVDLIRKGDEVRYTFHLSTELVSDTEILQNGEIKLNASGRLKSAVKAAKALSDKQ